MIPKLFDLSQVAEIAHAPRATVSFWVYSGRLASIKVGRRRLVTEDVLLAFLNLDGERGRPAATTSTRRGRR
jgi:hypothetical protein